MTSWKRVPLADILADGPSNGFSPKSEDGAQGTLTLKLSATTSGKFVLNDRTTKRIHETISPDSKFWLKPGDVVIQRANSLDYVGTTALFEGPADSYIFPDLMVRLRLKSVADPAFVVAYLNSPSTRAEFRSKATGTTGNMPKINGATIKAMEVPLPPLEVQRAVVSRLTILRARSSAAREALDAVPPLLEKLRQSILAAAFRGDLTKDWRAKNKNVEPASVLLDRIRAERRNRWEESAAAKMKAKGKKQSTDDSWKEKYKEGAVVDGTSLSALPPGWAWTTFDTVAEVDLGRQRAPQYQTGRFTRPYLRVANIKDDRLKLDDVLEMDFDEGDFAHYALHAGDILLSEGQSPELVGQSAIYRGEIPGLCFQKTLHRFRAYPSGPVPEFSQLVFRHYVRNGTFRAIASLTTNIAHLTLVRLKRLHFPLPPYAEQVELTRRAASCLAHVERLARATSAARGDAARLERSTLAAAFTGSVSSTRAAEPGSVAGRRGRT